MFRRASSEDIRVSLARQRSLGLGSPGRRRLERRRSPRILLLLLALVLPLLLLALSRWHPGDATLRGLADGPLALAVSPAGLSLGRLFLPFPLRARPDAQPAPLFRGGALDLGAEAARLRAAAGGGCFAALQPARGDDPPALLLADAGRLRRVPLVPGGEGWQGLSCLHFRLVSAPEPPPGDDAALAAALAAAAWPLRDVPRGVGGAGLEDGPVAVVSSASSPAALAPYALSLANHREYARAHGYAALLSLVPPAALGGRSPKFAKHYALGTLAAGGGPARFGTLLHLDCDAWFASWAPLELALSAWPRTKELLVPDAGQLWVNSGVLAARAAGVHAAWTTRFFEEMLEARHGLGPRGGAGDGGGAGGGTGFKRDQPALWAVLAAGWAADGTLPRYQGSRCGAWWAACNPDANPVACWHACFLRPLAAGGPGWRWEGLRSLDSLPHLHFPALAGGAAPMPLHRLCLASCPSALARAPSALCAVLLGRKAAAGAPPRGADALSRCDGLGCARQLAAGGGAFIKHSGHQHWQGELARCVPSSGEQAAARLADAGVAACPLEAKW